MNSMLKIVAGLVLAGVAWGGEVYVVTDAQGNRMYTDRPQTLPAERVGVRSSSTDPAEVQARYDEQMKRYAADDEVLAQQQAKAADAARAGALSAEDLAKRCADSRQRYEAYVNAIRLYEQGPDGERHYLTGEELDAAREGAKRSMDEFCGGQ
jgi:hypothetical protein